MFRIQILGWIGLACAAPAWAAGADDDALSLADATSATTKTVRSDWRIFTELSAGQVALRQFAGSDVTADAQRLSVDVLFDKKLTQEWRVVFSDRLDLSRQSSPTASPDKTLNTLKETYLSWQPQSNRVLDAGRINARYGLAQGYNPTDFLRDGANRSITSVDPDSIRENRMGTAMLRGQMLWAGGSLTAIAAPKLADAPNDSSWSADLGSTNNRNRWLLAVSHPYSEGLNPQVMLFGDDQQPVQMGLNLATLFNDATVLHLEWSGGRMPSQLAQALTPSPPETFRNKVATGLTYTTSNKISLTAEYHYNGAAPTPSEWDTVRAGSPLDYARYRLLTQDRLELVTRHAAFFRGTWQDAFIHKLDLAAMLRSNQDDHSRLSWLEARYRFDKTEFAMQWQLTSGDAGTEYGTYPQHRNLQVLGRYFFE